MRQDEISINSIRTMVRLTPRRWRLEDGWVALNEPTKPGNNWSLAFPFAETFENLCVDGCPAQHIGVRQGTDGRPYTYLRCGEDDLDKVRHWLAVIGQYIALRDRLALSFALDFDRNNGNPSQPQTRIGTLRANAKPYDDCPTRSHYDAARVLTHECVQFLTAMASYRHFDAVVAMPPSSPTKRFNLPAVVGEQLAELTTRPYLRSAVRTVHERPAVKTLPLTEKIAALTGTIAVDNSSLRGRNILLIDDLYQSGISMNYVAMLLIQAGAHRIFGLAIEKTCRNDSNSPGGR